MNLKNYIIEFQELRKKTFFEILKFCGFSTKLPTQLDITDEISDKIQQISQEIDEIFGTQNIIYKKNSGKNIIKRWAEKCGLHLKKKYTIYIDIVSGENKKKEYYLLY